MDASEAGEGKLAFVLRLPIGVVGAISPFNFPLNLVAHKVAPAIAAGCPVVLKPASQTPLSAVALARLLIDECGLPAEQLHVVTGSGADVGDPLVEHPDVAMITFTGSPEVGWSIRGRAARKKVGLELGNNAPVIIEPRADLEAAAAKIAVAGYSPRGSRASPRSASTCTSRWSRRSSTLAPKVAALVVGDPLDEATDVSALISAGDRERVAGWIDEAVAAGAKVAVGGSERQRHAPPHGAHRRHPRHEGVRRGGVRARGRRWRATPPSTTRSAWRTTRGSGSRRRSSRPTSPSRCAASSTSVACW